MPCLALVEPSDGWEIETEGAGGGDELADELLDEDGALAAGAEGAGEDAGA